MNPQDGSGRHVPHMAWIRPTDIMLGRGPTCYNNPGNRVLRKLVKTNAIQYKSQAPRKQKKALVKLLISKLVAKGYRFLHRSAGGTWVEAPTTIVEKKVGHGLRDARLAADKTGGEMNALPKNFRPAITDQKHAHQGSVPSSVPTGDINNETEGSGIEKSGINDIGSNGMNPQCNAFPMEPHKTFLDLMASSAFSRRFVQDAMMANTSMMIQDGQEAFQDDNAASFILNEVLEVRSQSCPLVERGREEHNLDFFDREIESLELWGRCDNVSDILEPRPLHPAFGWSAEGAVDQERGGCDMNEHGAFQVVSSNITAARDARVVHVLGVALNIYGTFEESSDGCLVDDSPSESSVYSLDDRHNPCHWCGDLSCVHR